jgi:hypothetical protein
MARRSKIGKGIERLIAIAIVIAAFCIILFVALIPLILLVKTIIYRINFICAKKGIKNKLSDFWLNEEEKQEFKSIFINRKKLAAELAIAEKNALEAGIPRNNDGQFATRSNLGKEIRQVYSSHVPLIEDIGMRLQKLEEQPLVKWQSFNSIVAKLNVFQGSLLVWLGIVLYYLSSAYKQGSFEINGNAILSYYVSELDNIFAGINSASGIGDAIAKIWQHESIHMICYSFGGAIVSFFVFKCIFYNYGSMFSPKPPKVTMENIDLYASINDIS